MGKFVACPYYRYDSGAEIVCEDRKNTFDNRDKLRRYRHDFCGNVRRYNLCAIAAELNQKYEEGTDECKSEQ